MAKELSIEVALARDLLDAQFPDWKHLPLRPLDQAGTDNQIFRLGDDKCVRFPRVDWAAKTAAREQAIMGKFQALPLCVPRPLGLGVPASQYPWNWSVVSWIDGRALGMRQLDPVEAETLAESIHAIRAVKPESAFRHGPINNGRGCPLKDRDGVFLKATEALADEFDLADLRSVWAMCLDCERQDAEPVFLHGDLHGGNLIEQDGQLAGMIDWGLAGVGDGACDLSAAWCLCDERARDVFKDALAPGQDAWLRGAGWALSIACIYVAYYRDTPQTDCSMSRRTIRDVLAALS